MTINRRKHRYFSLLVTCVVAFCLLFTGMRVPDLTRPHRPKPSQRAIIESKIKESRQAVNKSLDSFAELPQLPELQAVLPSRIRPVPFFPPNGFPPLFPNSSRAPPCFLS